MKIAAGVKDCHLQQLAEVLEKLGVQLGIAPEISILNLILHILIEGRDIAMEVKSSFEIEMRLLNVLYASITHFHMLVLFLF